MCISEKYIANKQVCIECKDNSKYANTPTKSMVVPYMPTCPCGFQNCVCDPAYIKLTNPQWYEILFGDMTPDEVIEECIRHTEGAQNSKMVLEKSMEWQKRKHGSKHTAKINERCFWCFSDAADYEYLVELVDEADYDDAVIIAERELDYYGCPEEAPDYDRYYNAGYVEVVKSALEAASIQANYYVKML
ncbi:MAG: hypothetical protein IJ794_01600 [Lachnospiraceae bacterium]|nr:hypothetical protein [Lachnospiraceae bacterium]